MIEGTHWSLIRHGELQAQAVAGEQSWMEAASWSLSGGGGADGCWHNRRGGGLATGTHPFVGWMSIPTVAWDK